MRTTIEIPDALMHKALQTSKAKTKTMVIVMGLQELIHRHQVQQLRALRGRIHLTVDVDKSRDRPSRTA
jgi:hypothetical protein